jgi:hypothetical protein
LLQHYGWDEQDGKIVAAAMMTGVGAMMITGQMALARLAEQTE